MIVVTGVGKVVLGDSEQLGACDPTPLLRERKSRKYLGLQDDMAVVSAVQAVDTAGLGRALGERVGLYLSVGYIPFNGCDIDPVLEASLEDGRFSLPRFSSQGYTRAHPLLAFRCLPNMPAFHVSQTLDIQGPYFVTYPGAAQVYQAIELACDALVSGDVDAALVGGVAAQRNFLVEHHYRRMTPPVSANDLRDAAAFLVLELDTRAADRRARTRCCLHSMGLDYTPFDPTSAWPTPGDQAHVDGNPVSFAEELGAATLPALISDFVTSGRQRLDHVLHGRDGIVAQSSWRGSA